MDSNGSRMSPGARAASPYVGLSYYTEADAEWFFGRGDECRTIIGNLRAARLTVLYASSGVGKSSLLRAGVARQCRESAQRQLAKRGSARYVPVVFGAWRDEPVEDLIGAIESAVQPVLPVGTRLKLPPQGLTEAIEAATAAADAKLLIILDQFEEYFLYHANEHAGRRLADELAAAVNSVELRANFLIAIREDAYAGLGDLFAGKIANVFSNYLQLEYLDRDAARETIVKPIEHFNRLHAQEQPIEIEPQLVEAVLDQVKTGEVLVGESTRAPLEPGNGARARREEIETPYLQLVMSNLWSHEREQGSHVLRLATLQQLGGAREIIRAHLDGALAALAKDEYDTALDLFHYLVTPSGTKIAFAASDLAELVERPYEQVAGLLARLASEDTRILRHVPPPAGKSHPADRYELFHDVLAPAIVDWRRRALEQRKRAEDARERERLEREKHEAEARTREEARRRRAFQRLASGALALLVVAALLGVLALLAQRRAVANLKAAQASQLVADAERTLPGNPELSTLLALRALHLKYTAQAEAALREALPQLQEVTTLHVRSSVNSAVFSRNSRQVLAASESGTVSIWDLAGAKQALVLRGDAGAVNTAAFNPNDTEIVIATKGGTASIWDLATRKPLRVLERRAAPVNGAEFSPNGAEVVTASENGTASIWNAATGKQLRVLREPRGSASVESAEFSPNGAEVVTASENGTASIWNAETGEQLDVLGVSGEPVLDAAFSPDGREVVTGGANGTARIWDWESRSQVAALSIPEGPILSAAFSPDGTEVVTANQDDTASIFDVASSKQLMVLSGDEGPLRAATFSPDGRQVLTASQDGTARVWDASPWQRLTVLYRHAGAVDNAAFSPSGLQVVTANQNASASIWDIASGRSLPLSGDRGPVLDAAFSPDGTKVVTASEDGTARVWNAESGKPLSVLRARAGVVNSALFSPDGAEIVTADHDGTARIWGIRDMASVKQLAVLNARAGPVLYASFSPDGKEVVTAYEDGTVRIWDARNGKQLAERRVSEVAVLYAAFSPDGRKLLTATNGRSASILDLSVRQRPVTLRAGKGPIYGAAFSPDGSEVVTGSEDGTATIWSAASGTPLAVLSGREGALFGAAFSPDGREIVTANEDGAATIWSAELSGTVQQLERIAAQRLTTHALTQQERKTYLAG
jgi:WD40 repeat protein